jgi:hypothetical protein
MLFVLNIPKINPVVKKIQNNRNKWIQDVRKMDGDRLPELIMKYQAFGNRSQGQPLQRLLEC